MGVSITVCVPVSTDGSIGSIGSIRHPHTLQQTIVIITPVMTAPVVNPDIQRTSHIRGCFRINNELAQFFHQSTRVGNTALFSVSRTFKDCLWNELKR
jgi:hypothetical protein